jgi:hypothetical protein
MRPSVFLAGAAATFMFASGCGTAPVMEPETASKADDDRADTRGLSDPYLAIAGLYQDPVGADRPAGVRSLRLGGSPEQYNHAILTLYPERPTQRIEGTFELKDGQILMTLPAPVTDTCSLPADCGVGYTCEQGACASKGPLVLSYTASAKGVQLTALGLPSQFLARYAADVDYFFGGAFKNRASDGALKRVWFAQLLPVGDYPVTRDANGCRIQGETVARVNTSWADGDEDLIFSLGSGVLDLWGSATGTAPHATCGAYTDVRVADHRYLGFTLEGQGTFDLFAKLVTENGVSVWHDATTGAAIPFCQKQGDTECAPPLPPRY